MNDMIKPQEITIKTQDGEEKTYVISKVPAIPARELVAKYPVANMPKLGDYAVSEEVMLKLMSYVAVVLPDGQHLRLTSQALVNNHVPDWETLARIELKMMEYNCSFFGRAGSLISSETIEKKAKQLITEILTDSLARSFPKKQRRSGNSKQSMTSKTPS